MNLVFSTWRRMEAPVCLCLSADPSFPIAGRAMAVAKLVFIAESTTGGNHDFKDDKREVLQLGFNPEFEETTKQVTITIPSTETVDGSTGTLTAVRVQVDIRKTSFFLSKLRAQDSVVI